MSIAALLLFLFVAFLGVPVAHALLFGSMIAIQSNEAVSVSIIIEQMVAQASSYPLLAIPFFVLTGSLMLGGALGQHLLGMLTSLLGRVHGGPGQVSVLSSTLFGGISGSAVADVAGLGPLLINWQKKLGYPPAFAAATLASAATIDILLPPSIPFIIYALMSGASITALFIAGIIPGLFLSVGFTLVCYIQGRRRNFPRDTTKFEWATLRRQAFFALPAIILPVFILVVLRFGIATPTEVSVLAAFMALLFSTLLYRDMTWERLRNALYESGVATGIVLLLIMASSVMGWVFTYEELPARFVQWVSGHITSKEGIILMMNLMLLVVGMVIDLTAAILLFTPIMLPMAASIGMDPVHLGVIMVVNLAIGLYTPPVGSTLFLTSAIARVNIGDTVREMVPFYLVALLLLALVSYAPGLLVPTL